MEETVFISACKSCNEPFEVIREARSNKTKDVQVICDHCGKVHFYRKAEHADARTDMKHIAKIL